MDSIIFGDNQFFGIDHMSEERAIAKAIRFQDNAAIIRVIDTAYDLGIHAFTFSTHDRVRGLLDHFRENPQKYADLRLYPTLPYAYKYAHSVAEKGILETIKETLFANTTATQMAKQVARGGLAMLNKDAVEMMKLLVDVEMKMFHGLDVRVVFLQNIVTDLVLGLGCTEMFAHFASHLEERYGIRAGFITFNLPRLVRTLLDAGLENPIVCSSINPAGFQMNPSREACEETLDRQPFTAVAMSILAAGAVTPQAAAEYLRSHNKVRSVIFGASSGPHIEETRRLLMTRDAVAPILPSPAFAVCS